MCFLARLNTIRTMIALAAKRVGKMMKKYEMTNLSLLHHFLGIGVIQEANNIFIHQKKFLVPRDMYVGQFIHILSIRLHLTPRKALFVFRLHHVFGTILTVCCVYLFTASRLDSIYETYKEDDENFWLILPSPPLII
ncbi:autophagy-related protein 8h [Pyrus ussuriensis x Pyrus communis]|uniref:Autophagy-related protein 8h n=1 Tax=Pyrus ussuriensis x Pyrus communis TaxID=2448454 RepID=A0A5N5HG92_9ROSA|nr:autophagy-related protein 8h [Pyrus ussuriensis x Pyrus communis]